jgi:hypothetical protein
MPLQLVSALRLVAMIACAWALSRDRLGLRAMIDELLACYLAATVVGVPS